MARIPMTGGFTPMDEGIQVLRIYGVEYKEAFGNLTIYMCNAKAQTMRETFRFKSKDGKPNEGAMNAFSYFAKTAMDDFDMDDVDPQELVGHYIQVDVVHNDSNGRTYANLGRDKAVAYEFDESPAPEALTMTLTTKHAEVKDKQKAQKSEAPQEAPQTNPEAAQNAGNYNLDDLLG